MHKKLILILILSTTWLTSGDFAVVKSAILPGWGELSMDHPKRAKSFFLREGIIWLSYLGGKNIYSWYKSDYEAFARLHADVDLRNQPYQLAVDMGLFDNLYEYNSNKDRRREVYLKYPEGEGYDWNWDSTTNRKKFNDMRITSATADKVASFAVGGLIAHRIISVFDILYLKKKSGNIRMNSSLIPMGRDNIYFVVSLNF